MLRFMSYRQARITAKRARRSLLSQTGSGITVQCAWSHGDAQHPPPQTSASHHPANRCWCIQPAMARGRGMSGHHHISAGSARRSSGKHSRRYVAEPRSWPLTQLQQRTQRDGLERCSAHGVGSMRLPHPPGRKAWEQRSCAAGPTVRQDGESLRMSESMRLSNRPAQAIKKGEPSGRTAVRRGLPSISGKRRPNSKAQLALMTDSGEKSRRTAASQDRPGNSSGPVLSGLRRRKVSRRTAVRSGLPGMSGTPRPIKRGGIAPQRDQTASRQKHGQGG